MQLDPYKFVMGRYGVQVMMWLLGSGTFGCEIVGIDFFHVKEEQLKGEFCHFGSFLALFTVLTSSLQVLL